MQDRLGKLSGGIFATLTLLGILFSINNVFQIMVGLHEFVYYYGLLSVFLSSCFLIYPLSKKTSQSRVPLYDILLFLICVASCVYIIFNAYRITNEGWVMTGPPSATIVSISLWVLALEALRRTSGNVLLAFVLLFSIYPLFAENLPGSFGGTGWSLAGAAKFHALTRESIIGAPTKVFCEVLVGFMLFGVVLHSTGGAKFFIDIAFSAFGKVRGGPAKVAVVASFLFGSISGSAISNVVTTGTVTIPVMKKGGYQGYYAAAIEACAASGGCIMPPVMGAVAFVMASFLNVTYSEVAFAALVPAVLYFFGLFVQIDGHAAKMGISGLPTSQIPPLKSVLKIGWIYLAAVFVLVIFIFTLKREAQGPFYASGFLIILAMFYKETRINLATAYTILINSGKILTNLLGTMAGVGLIIGGLSMTGMAIALPSELLSAVGDNPFVLLFVGSLICYILGMGMTVTACYVFLAVILVPALTPLGFDIMAVHLFIVYCGLFSFITPPVALAAYVAAGIAEANFWKTSIQAMGLGFVKYIIPFLFVYNPALLMHGSFINVLFAVLTGFLGVFILGSIIEGYMLGVGKMNNYQRGVFAVSGSLLLLPENISDAAGFVIFSLMYVLQTHSRLKTKLNKVFLGGE